MTDRTQETLAQDRKYVRHAMSGYSADSADSGKTRAMEGKGLSFTDINGDRYLDGSSGLRCINVGCGRIELAGPLRAAREDAPLPVYQELSPSHRARREAEPVAQRER